MHVPQTTEALRFYSDFSIELLYLLDSRHYIEACQITLSEERDINCLSQTRSIQIVKVPLSFEPLRIEESWSALLLQAVPRSLFALVDLLRTIRHRSLETSRKHDLVIKL